MKTLLILLLLPSLAFSQSESFDIFKFTAPEGWTRKQEKVYIDLRHNNPSTGKFAQIVIYASRAGGTDAVKELTADWKDLMTFTKQDAPAKKEINKLNNGWTVASAETMVNDGQKQFVSSLVVIMGYGRVGDIMVSVDDEAALPVIQTFLTSVGMMDAQEVAKLYPTAGGQTQNTGTVATLKGNEISGFYRSACHDGMDITGITNASGTGYSSITTTTGKLRMRHVVLFPDGTFCHWPFDHGLLDYKTTRAQQPNYWGTYTYQNGSGSVKLDGSSSTTSFIFQNGKLAYDHCVYDKLPFVENLKLNGTYTIESDEATYKSAGMNAEPTIRFSPDGRFSDTGAVYYLNHVKSSSTDMSDNTYGDGTYHIANFVILLTFDDGRRYEYTYLNLEGATPTPRQMGMGFNWANRK